MFPGLPAQAGIFSKKSSLIKMMGSILAICFLMCASAQADWAWNTLPDIPDNDARWQQLKTLDPPGHRFTPGLLDWQPGNE